MTRGSGRGGTSAAPRSVDVARLAGISQKTVSRVFNAEPYVSAEVRRRVLQAAEQLGYRPNNAARALASGRTRSIGVVTLGTTLYGPASLLMGVERAVREAGYALCVVNTWEGDAAGIGSAVDSLLDQGVDGVIVSEPIDESSPDGDSSARLDVPVITVGADLAARTATEYLLDLGHATVHHLAGPQGWHAARNQLEGWRTALAAHGSHEPPVIKGDWSAASGYTSGREAAADVDMTAVFAANDDMAIGLIRALTEAGRRVPDDVSVVGCDDIPVAAYLNPPLTTVRQPFAAVAQEGLQRLVRCIENPQADSLPVRLPPVDLVVRGSTAPPPLGAIPRRRLSGQRSVPAGGDGRRCDGTL